MTKYKSFFFDIDHTLWDFERNALETLQNLYENYEFQTNFGFSFDLFFTAFKKVNYSLWTLYDKHQIGKEELRKERFARIFDELGLDRKNVPAKIGEDFIYQCPRKGNLMPNAEKTLQFLAKNSCKIYAVTNGFRDTQLVKVEHSALKDYLLEVFTSECSGGFKKPEKGIFDHAFKKTGAQKQESVMAGDKFETDVEGGVNFGIDVFYYVPEGNHDKNAENNPKIKLITDLYQICDFV
jgi:putative hydrolase of the HAD superfamily